MPQEFSDEQIEEYMELIKSLGRKELIQLIAGMQYCPATLLRAAKEQLRRTQATSWY